MIAVTFKNISAIQRNLLCNNLRRNDVTFIHHARCRNVSNNVTIDVDLIHSMLLWCCRILWCCSIEVATICMLTEVFCCRIEVLLHRVVCFIKVYGIDFDTRLHDFMKRMVSGKDQLMITITAGMLNKPANITGFSRRLVMSFATVNMKHIGISDMLKILRRQLLSKQNARSNNYNSLWSFLQKLTDSVSNTHKSLTCTCSRTDNTFGMILKYDVTFFLMWTQRNHVSFINEVTIPEIWWFGKSVCQLFKCPKLS